MRKKVQELSEQIDRSALPAHIAIIMDGNGRWARKRGLPRVAGHRAGISAVREVVEGSAELGIPVLTLYAFSVENWKRPRAEISTLMQLLKEYLAKELDNIHKNKIRFRTIGRTDELDPSVRHELEKGIERTHANSGMIFNVALNYSGRAEIVDDLQLGRRVAAADRHRQPRWTVARRAVSVEVESRIRGNGRTADQLSNGTQLRLPGQCGREGRGEDVPVIVAVVPLVVEELGARRPIVHVEQASRQGI